MKMIRRDSFFIWQPDPTVSLEAFIPENREDGLPGIIILPGGAYFAISETESDSVAQAFAGMGFAAYVLHYSTMHPSFDRPDTAVNTHTIFPEPLQVVAAACAHVRRAYGKVCLVGFSAGGHLAANYCNEWNTPEVRGERAAEEIRPDACVLCYAATELKASSAAMNMAVFGRRDSYPEALRRRWWAAENVNRDTPPTFLWHTVTDNMVPVAQTYRMAQALNDEGIVHECHIFSEGPHAVGLSEGYPAQVWPELAKKFIERYV